MVYDGGGRVGGWVGGWRIGAPPIAYLVARGVKIKAGK